MIKAKPKASHVLVCLGVALVVFWASNKQIKSPTSKGDIETYLNASRLLLQGENIYATPNRGTDYYLYPPLLATLLIPLTLLPITVAIYFWCTLKVLMVVWIVRATYRGMTNVPFSSLPSRTKWMFGFFPFLLSGRFILHELSYGQAHLLLLTFAVLGVQLALHGKETTGGVGIGVSAVFKVVSLPLAIWFSVRKESKVLIGMLIGGFIGLILPGFVAGFDKNLFYLSFWFRNIILSGAARDHYWPTKINFSLYAQLLRFFSNEPAFDHGGRQYTLTILQLPTSYLHLAPLVIMFAVSMLIAWYAWRFRHGPRLVANWGGAALTFSLIPIFSPVSLEHHFVVLLPAYAYVVYLWHHLSLKDIWFKGLVITSFVLNTLTAEIFVGNHLRDIFLAIGCLAWGTLLLSFSIFRAGVCLKEKDGFANSTWK